MANLFLSIFSCFCMLILPVEIFVFDCFSFVKMPKYRSGEVQMLGISHSGIRLIKRSRTKTSGDILKVLESFLFDHIQQISPIRNGSTMDLRLTKKRITIHSHRVFITNENSNVYF